MSKILEIKREGHQVVMTVQLESGHKQNWTYEKEETSTGRSFIMVDREELV